jgi:hypothetical protein
VTAALATTDQRDGAFPMAEMKWRSFAKPGPDKAYVALVSYLPLKRYWMLPALVKNTLEIQAQLGRSKGLIGYSLLAQLLRLEFWTLSVWEDERALMEFVHGEPHSRVMEALRPYLGKTAFAQWKLEGSDVPPVWPDAMKRVQPDRP